MGTIADRMEVRHEYHHRLSITYHHQLSMEMNRHFGRGEVLDWSTHGLHIVSSVPLENGRSYQVRFHVEKNHGLSWQKEFLTREGEVRWIEKQTDGWHIGIRLDDAVEKLDEYITEEDSCYIFVMPGIIPQVHAP